MKKIFILFSIFAIALTSCEGDQGPIGPEGQQGPPGPRARTIQYNPVDFTYVSENGQNLWATVLDYGDLEVALSDAVLVYLLEEVPGDNGTIEVWNQLPFTVYADEATFQYSFNHNDATAELLIQSNDSLENLDEQYTTNRIARVVIVDSDDVAKINNTSDINEVMNTLGIQQEDIKYIN